ncbi:hypothetical protein BP6252_12500 [Coleophoma cylindrospora]|uniref:Uncharacterized protein n=1 Tax=Coleophoma cylindrospora TaxID=1849047 RepID=A0A3D8QC31_9HELO|nr:hypothetical protein BP6252_12500 [Coleophoma cylindrospora]
MADPSVVRGDSSDEEAGVGGHSRSSASSSFGPETYHHVASGAPFAPSLTPWSTALSNSTDWQPLSTCSEIGDSSAAPSIAASHRLGSSSNSRGPTTRNHPHLDQSTSPPRYYPRHRPLPQWRTPSRSASDSSSFSDVDEAWGRSEGSQVLVSPGVQRLDTPDTSEADSDEADPHVDADNIGVEAVGQPQPVELMGLEYPEHLRNLDIAAATHNDIDLDGHQNQNGIAHERHAQPWTPWRGSGMPNSHASASAPAPGYVYDTFYSSLPSGVSQLSRRLTQTPEPHRRAISSFHPGFLIAHLQQRSTESFTSQIHAPEGIFYNTEYQVSFNLGLGPPIPIKVSPFNPRNTIALRSFQKQVGKEELDVKDSLPISIHLFAVHSMAERLNVWLDAMISSAPDLSAYVKLVMEREGADAGARALHSTVSWFTECKSRLSEKEQDAIRHAFKILITTTLLSLVPRVINIPKPLQEHLSQTMSCCDTSISVPSPVAPKLLTRQIKSSIYHLQMQLLDPLFSQLESESDLVADVRLATTMLIAIALDMVRDAGRDFAKYANKINPEVVVTEQEVRDYEEAVQSFVFPPLQASVCYYGADGRKGKLGERLRNLETATTGTTKTKRSVQCVLELLDAGL